MPDTYVSSNGSHAIVSNTHDAARLSEIGWTRQGDAEPVCWVVPHHLQECTYGIWHKQDYATHKFPEARQPLYAGPLPASAPTPTNADTMEREFGSAPVHAPGGLR